ncbi:hypothetical protein DFH29DRAFT_953759, partial [Suillus ampliporus]
MGPCWTNCFLRFTTYLPVYTLLVACGRVSSWHGRGVAWADCNRSEEGCRRRKGSETEYFWRLTGPHNDVWPGLILIVT